ncbi:MAG TPA: response regulator [Patescibacteria group bacterium]|nr:response regulator [Patescibacteria group bacterium]
MTKILLVEDDVFFQKFYTSKLKEEGMEVYTASNGEEGLQKAREIIPSLIILDIIMPKKDGFEMLKDMSQDSTLKKIPVIIFSTLGQEEDVKKAKQLGALDYVDKSSFDFANLKAKIMNIIGRSTPS